jgi:O-antigen biosynthesis protein
MKPTFSIILPVFNTDIDHLTSCILSVLEQDVSDWELCIVDDFSTQEDVRPLLNFFAHQDDRIRVHFQDQNGGISSASNQAVQLARGEYVMLLDHDDLLAKNAVSVMKNHLSRNPGTDFCYSDEYVIEEGGNTREIFKPIWSPERLRTQNYVGHLVAIRRELFHRVGGFRSDFDGSQDYDLFFRVSEQARKISHVPVSLYYWRESAASYSHDLATHHEVRDSGCRAVQEHCDRQGINARVSQADTPWAYRVDRVLSEEPSVTIIQLPGIPVGATSFHASYSTLLNNLVADVDSGLVCFVRSDIEAVTSDWMLKLAALASESDVGAVAATIVDTDLRLLHTGYRCSDGQVLTYGKGIDIGHQRSGAGRAMWTREVLACSSSAMMISKDKLDRVGGFTPTFTSQLADVDFGQKLRALGMRNIHCADAIVKCTGGWEVPGSWHSDMDTLSKRWWHDLHFDPYDRPRGAGDDPWQKSTFRRAR